MKVELAERIKHLPPYLFAELDRLKAEQIRKGVDVIDLGVGDPDQPTPRHIVHALQKAAEEPANHQYPSYSGMTAFREAASRYMKRRFGVSLDPMTEVVSLIGSKEGISNIPYAFVNPGDIVLIPSPGYPPYTSGTLFAGGKLYFMPLKRELGFLPDLKAIPKDVLKKAKIIHINYPNNPTAATAPKSYYEEVVSFAKEHGIIVCSDAAYIEHHAPGEKPLSFLEIPGARDVAVEFHSLSKTYNMTGWRIGFACGHGDIVGGLGRIKTNIDSGIFQPIQYAGIAALDGDQACVESMRKLYAERRTTLVNGLKGLGYDVASAGATFYVWVAVPSGETSKGFAMKVLEKVGVVITPGVGFGDGGEGYVRFTLTQDVKRLEETLLRFQKIA